MEMRGSGSTTPNQLSDVAWDDIARFVRQLSHDLRNHMNAVELQSSYIGEIATDPEIKDEVKRLRGMLAGLGAALQKLSSDVAPPRLTLIPYKAADFLEDLRSRFASTAGQGGKPVTWEVQICDTMMIQLDPQLMPLAVQELLDNAARSGDGPFSLKAIADKSGNLQLMLVEPKVEGEVKTRDWGREPLRNISQGHYGLGLNRARLIIEAHGGQLAAHYEQGSQTLVSTITLPASSAKG